MSIIDKAREICEAEHINLVECGGFDSPSDVEVYDFDPVADASSSNEQVAVIAKIQQRAADSALAELCEAALTDDDIAGHFNAIIDVLTDNHRDHARDGKVVSIFGEETETYAFKENYCPGRDGSSDIAAYGNAIYSVFDDAAHSYTHSDFFKPTEEERTRRRKALQRRVEKFARDKSYFCIEDIVFARNGDSRSVRQRKKRVTAAERAAAIRARRTVA